MSIHEFFFCISFCFHRKWIGQICMRLVLYGTDFGQLLSIFVVKPSVIGTKIQWWIEFITNVWLQHSRQYVSKTIQSCVCSARTPIFLRLCYLGSKCSLHLIRIRYTEKNRTHSFYSNGTHSKLFRLFIQQIGDSHTKCSCAKEDEKKVRVCHLKWIFSFSKWKNSFVHFVSLPFSLSLFRSQNNPTVKAHRELWQKYKRIGNSQKSMWDRN